MIQLSETQFQQIVELLSEIADLAGAQGYSDVEALTEKAILTLEQAALAVQSSTDSRKPSSEPEEGR